MAAKKGNEWWKLRSKHGRDKIFENSNQLWESCAEYFEATDKRKWNKVEYKGNPPKKFLIPTETPYTITGLCLFLGVNSKYFNDFKKALEGKNDDKSKGFSEVITRVEDIIYTQKFEGAAVFAFSHVIIARDLGLVEKKENQHSGSVETIVWREEKTYEAPKE
ncbi:terminase small subunit [Flavobacterium enshiense]|uniref:terminase small subunit n=1 Tax=Flavobacterium enshiense TaxID=1341165 RepID=UPI00345D72B8